MVRTEGEDAECPERGRLGDTRRQDLCRRRRSRNAGDGRGVPRSRSLRCGEQFLEQAQTEIALWYTDRGTHITRPLQTEYPVRDVVLDEWVKLTGVLDLMQFEEGSDIRVSVTDFKTGRPKTRNEILGKTASSDGDYYRQLTFYKLLLKYHRGGQYEMTTGAIEFIRPDESIKSGRRIETFEIPNDDVLELEQAVIRVADEITNLSFWDKEPTPDCEFRDLVKWVKRCN